MKSPYDISDTGIRGFLKWLQVAQPGIYQQVADKIARQFPGAFSDYHASGMGGLGLATSADLGLADPTTQTPGLVQIGFDPNTMQMPAVDVSSVANVGSSSSDIVGGISSLIDSVTRAYMQKKAADTNAQVIQTQLQRAQAGQPPLAINPSKYGIPIISATSPLASNPLVWVGGGALLLLLLFGARRAA